MKINFTDWEPGTRAVKETLLDIIDICEEYDQQGYQITIRQLYYQMVQKNLIANDQKQYKRIIEIAKNGREGGWIDWEHIVDLVRALEGNPHWDSPEDIIQAAVNSYRVDRWAGQERYVELWCEKDALSSVLLPIANQYDVNFMANHGYSSASAMFKAAERVARAEQRGQVPTIIYLGDHDPSGLNMTFDIEKRLELLTSGADVEVIRLALNYDQVLERGLPPNPVKLKDSRAYGYISAHGLDCWELDALSPPDLNALIGEIIEGFRDPDIYAAVLEREAEERARLQEMADEMIADTEDDDEGE